MQQAETDTQVPYLSATEAKRKSVDDPVTTQHDRNPRVVKRRGLEQRMREQRTQAQSARRLESVQQRQERLQREAHAQAVRRQSESLQERQERLECDAEHHAVRRQSESLM